MVTWGGRGKCKEVKKRAIRKVKSSEGASRSWGTRKTSPKERGGGADEEVGEKEKN